MAEEFGRAEIALGAETLAVAVADDPVERARGLMGVDDLGGLDGMLFVFDGDTEAGFWMEGILISLDIAFFAADGSLVDRLRMDPCSADSCPIHRASGPYRYALEVPAGRLSDVGVLLLDPASLPGRG